MDADINVDVDANINLEKETGDNGLVEVEVVGE